MTKTSDLKLSPILAAGFLLAGAGITLGAFGAHALAPSLTPKALETFKTAQAYHMHGAYGLIALGVVHTLSGHRRWISAAWAMGAGLAVFALTVYGLALGGPRWLGAITPVGGGLMIGAWLFAALGVLRDGRTGRQ
jgi:uncharacterized membrane protein YgdD (TMEM256/DUF423 family)